MDNDTISLRRDWPLLLLFLAAVIGIGYVVGIIAAPGDYVQSLNVPDLVLPEPISGLLWLALSIAFAVAGWRLWLIDSNSTAMRLWLATLILSWWFSPAFFLMRSPVFALAIISALALLMVWFIVRAWTLDRVSALLFIPCFVYIGYVVAMTGAIVAMN